LVNLLDIEYMYFKMAVRFFGCGDTILSWASVLWAGWLASKRIEMYPTYLSDELNVLIVRIV
jgi:hypothetical protein